MAVASTKTQLPLDRFARIAGIDPLHFNQVQVDTIDPIGTCSMPLLQYSYQNADRTGREEIAQTIADVEERVSDYLNFAFRPTFFNNYPTTYPRPANPELLSGSIYDIRGLIRAVKVDGQGYLISGGREVKSPLTLGAVVTYTDTDGDGYAETATVTSTNVDPYVTNYTASTPVVDPNDVAVYYPGQGAADEWEIRPIKVAISGGTITCTFHREQAVIPDRLFGISVEGVDGLVGSNFLATVDVYHHWLDPSAEQVEFRWEQTPWMIGSSIAQFATQAGAMLVTDAKLGWAAVQAAHWDVPAQQYLMDCFSVVRMPDTVRLWFKAGWELDNWGNMAGQWERLITYLTLASLDRPLCQCETLRTFTEHWAYDLAMSNPNNTQQIARKRLENPLGTTRASVYAWEQILRRRLPDYEAH